mmetsp:Transcript_24375/g.25455  ORF Transcript_24375/g.25455 Transcript_24375/m.25455 type:complete len:596 (-) Transcript_24375:78-1865(-)
MRLVLLLTLIGIAGISCSSKYAQIFSALDNSNPKTLFKVWHTMHEKPYDLNTQEAIRRYNIFTNNLSYINKVNSENRAYKLSIAGPFADMTYEEFKSTVLSRDLAKFAEEAQKEKTRHLRGLSYFDDVVDGFDPQKSISQKDTQKIDYQREYDFFDATVERSNGRKGSMENNSSIEQDWTKKNYDFFDSVLFETDATSNTNREESNEDWTKKNYDFFDSVLSETDKINKTNINKDNKGEDWTKKNYDFFDSVLGEEKPVKKQTSEVWSSKNYDFFDSAVGISNNNTKYFTDHKSSKSVNGNSKNQISKEYDFFDSEVDRISNTLNKSSIGNKETNYDFFDQAVDFIRSTDRYSDNYSSSTQSSEAKDWSYLWNYVPDQKSCGSCWAFATAGLIEAHNYIKSGQPTPRLSVQQLIDCESNSHGCAGGFFSNALNYSKAGLQSESDYSYQDGEYFRNKDQWGNYPPSHSCKYDPSLSKAKSNGYEMCWSSSKYFNCQKLDKKIHKDDLIKKYIQRGPYGGMIYAHEDMMHYSSGVLDTPCDEQVNHAVIVVQLTENTLKYRNSWGETWGQNGYGEYRRDINNNHTCWMESAAYIPKV